MGEVKVKTHLIVSDIHDEFNMKWCGKIKDTKPKIENGKPIFVIVGSKGRVEMNTTDMVRIEKNAKNLTQPRGRSAISTDTARVYILEVDGKETLMGVLTHNRVKTFQQMYDKVGFY